MEFTLNIPDWLKIPINILLPALWLVSGILLFLPDTVLEQFYLLDLCNKHGSKIGLAFVVTSALLFMYAFFFVKKLISAIIYKLTFKWKTMNRISEMNDAEKGIIVRLYNSPGYSGQLDYNQPIVQGLLARNYIYMGGTQQVTAYLDSNAIYANVTLQPFVYQTLDHYQAKMEKIMSKLEKKISKGKKAEKKSKLRKELSDLRGIYDLIYNGGIY